MLQGLPHLSLVLCCSKYSLQTSSTGLIWELVRKLGGAGSGVRPKGTLPLVQNLREHH